MLRKPKKDEGDLANILEDKARQLEKFMQLDSDMPALRESLTEKEMKELQDILKSVGSQAAPLEILLDRGIKDLEGHGMQFNQETQKMENIFAKHSTDKVIDGVSITDKSTFSPEENFGEVIKRAFGLDWKKDTDAVQADGTTTRGISGMVRQQACCEMVQQYEKDMKENKEVETEFLRDVIGLRTKHNAILGAATDTLDFLATSVDEKQAEKNRETAKMSAGGQLASVITSLREAADSVRKMNDYSHLMTAREFQSVSRVLHFRRPEILKQIDHQLRILQEPPPTKLMFWKKQVPLSSDQRSAHLETLKSLVEEAKISPDVDARRKAGLEKLLPQVDYAIQKTLSVQMQEKQRRQEKLVSLKEPAPKSQSAHLR